MTDMKRLYIALLLLAVIVPATAQKKKGKVVKKPIAAEVKETPADRLYATMLPATAKVMFIDSMVVDRDSFLTKIPLGRESGKILSYQQFFGRKRATTVPMSVYVNEFGDQAYYAEEDTINGNVLYRTDWLGDKWSKRSYVDGIGDEFCAINYPFVMSDGITLFFAAKGEKSVGGYDIFTTTFDSENGKFYQPQNYGLPFNSKANDYFLAIDEFDNLGWLVSDRFQPAGKVCVYTFVPSATRQNFEEDNLTDAQIAAYAHINRISDTWKFGDRKAALDRLNNLLTRLQANQHEDEYFDFVINDQTTYHRLSDFKGKANRQLYLTLNGQRASLKKRLDELQALRDRYATLDRGQKQAMQMEIVNKEREADLLSREIKDSEKKIRNAENQLINK